MVITVFTCTKLADLGDPGLYPVVETDSWRLHNDTSKKVLPIQRGIQEFPLESRCSTRRDPNCHCIRSRPLTFNTILKGGFLIIEMANICPLPVSTRKTNRQRQISSTETALGGNISDYSPTLWYLFYVTILVWCCTILNSMCIVPLPLSNNI